MACILVLMLSNGIVASRRAVFIRQSGFPSHDDTQSLMGYLQTVIRPAPAPAAKVPVEPSLPDSGLTTVVKASCSAVKEENLTALFAACFIT